jgi:predicted enzyme related to lactoylglutathione lyase
MRAHVVIDSQDPERITAFWCGLLGVSVWRSTSDNTYTALRPSDNGLMLVLQRVPEPKAVKNRVHLDFQVEDLEEATARAVDLGGRWTEPGTTLEVDGIPWRCMADPEGNEFCIYTMPS